MFWPRIVPVSGVFWPLLGGFGALPGPKPPQKGPNQPCSNDLWSKGCFCPLAQQGGKRLLWGGLCMQRPPQNPRGSSRSPKVGVRFILWAQGDLPLAPEGALSHESLGPMASRESPNEAGCLGERGQGAPCARATCPCAPESGAWRKRMGSSVLSSVW